MNKIKAAVAGSAGYTGGEMCRLLLNHPDAELVCAQSASNHGQPLWSVHSDLFGDTDLLFAETVDPDADVLFLCMGHGKSARFLETNEISEKTAVIDLGNDFRLAADAGFGHRKFVYGLNDFFADEIAGARSVANPGCFATAIQLAVLPLAQAGALQDDIHITAVTGSTGAGQALSATTHFSWRDNNLSTYKTFTHQHLGEIGQSIGTLQPGFGGNINFIPYRGDFTRGIIATVHTRCGLTEQEAKELYRATYSDSPFTHCSEQPVHLKQVVNTNKALLHVEKHGDYLLVTSVIDNLLKGAAGQAVENMNLVFGFGRTAGLRLKPSAF